MGALERAGRLGCCSGGSCSNPHCVLVRFLLSRCGPLQGRCFSGDAKEDNEPVPIILQCLLSPGVAAIHIIMHPPTGQSAIHNTQSRKAMGTRDHHRGYRLRLDWGGQPVLLSDGQ